MNQTCETKKCDSDKPCCPLMQELQQNWGEVPDQLKDMLRSLAQQKIAVLEKLRTWAKASNRSEMVKNIEAKIERAQKKLNMYSS
ncbi:MAG: hypothetical protein ILP11_02400 [Alphaproteobacteria bacterium]|nr:hypothetical protein [Alphaproteobacteria bacterium]